MTTQKQQISWLFRPLSRDFDRQSFDCGIPALNQYLQVLANQHQKSNISKTTVALPAPNSKEIAGYYTLNASRLDIEALPSSSRKKLPNSLDIPCIKIGQLAVDKRYTGQRLGEELLMHALYKCCNTSIQLGVHSIVVDAYNDTAKRFWLRYEFIPFVDQSNSLFLPIKSARKLFEA